jgi:hypothetical protein
MKGITEMLLKPTDPDHKGARLLPGMPNGWGSLHDALMNHVPSGAFLGHAGGPMRISAFHTSAPLYCQIGYGPVHKGVRSPLLVAFFGYKATRSWSPPAFKFDMISTGPDEGQELRNWKMQMSNDDFWQSVEQDISKSIDNASDLEISDDEPPRDGDADFAGGRPPPPADGSGGEDGNGAHPARATLVIDIGNPRSV